MKKTLQELEDLGLVQMRGKIFQGEDGRTKAEKEDTSHPSRRPSSTPGKIKKMRKTTRTKKMTALDATKITPSRLRSFGQGKSGGGERKDGAEDLQRDQRPRKDGEDLQHARESTRLLCSYKLGNFLSTDSKGDSKRVVEGVSPAPHRLDFKSNFNEHAQQVLRKPPDEKAKGVDINE